MSRQHRSCMSLIGILVAMALSSSPAFGRQRGQRPPSPVKVFQALNVPAKRGELRKLAARPLPPTIADAVDVVAVALQDDDPIVRRAACGVIEAIEAKAGAARISTDPATEGAWKQARPAFLSLDERLLSLITTDPDPRVRLEAVVAGGNLEYDGGPKGVGMRIGERFAETLAEAYGQEQDPMVRSEIVKGLALVETKSPAQVRLLKAAVTDVSPMVLQYAVIGVGRLRLVALLPEVVAFLRHEDRRVRLSAARALSDFGPTAKKYAQAVRDAAAVEGDDLVRKTMEGLLHTMEK